VQHPIRIVLVETSHPGNIGAAARALKNMCLDELVLVRPAQFPHPEASARASGAEDVLTRARVEQSLPAAVGDCGLVLATTSRDRDQYFRVLDVHDAAREALAASNRGPVAVLFGSERTGLSNAELECAHALLCIPANPDYASLNLAMAVQLVAYEILRARLALETASAGLVSMPGGGPRRAPLASAAQMRQFYTHLAQVLEEVDFRDRTQKGTHLMNRLRRLFQRAAPDENEINILRGILTAVQQRRRRAGDS
jgi:TrmH family RNA methyltransferase